MLLRLGFLLDICVVLSVETSRYENWNLPRVAGT